MARRALALLLAAPLALAACSRSGGAPSPGASAAPARGRRRASGSSPRSNGAPILASELEPKLASRLARLRQEEYEIRRQALEELIAERLVAAEAAKRRITPEELLRQEVDAKAAALPGRPGRDDLRAEQGRASPASPGRTRSRASARSLGQRAKAERRAAFEKELRDAARVAVRLDVPAGHGRRSPPARPRPARPTRR